LQGFAFPASVKVEFDTPLPASGPKRAAMIGYENYVDSMWYAVYSRGSSTAYQEYAGGNALTFVQNLVKEFSQYGLGLRGKIVYYDISVGQIYYGAGAVVSSCVDASGLDRFVAKTGRSLGTVFSAQYDRYLEQASAAKSKAGFWTVGHTGNSPASGGGSSGMCA